MNREEHIQVITDKEEIYDKCENMEQLFDKYYLPLLVKHFSKVYQLEQENKELSRMCELYSRSVYYAELTEAKERINKAIEYIKIYRSYQKIDNKDYLKGRDEIGCLDICQVDELLDILKEVE